MAKKKHKKVRQIKRRVTRVKRKPVKRHKRRTATRKRHNKVAGVKRKPVKHRKRRTGRKLVKQVEKRSVERVMSGKYKRKKRTAPKRRVVMAGRSRRRTVTGKGGTNTLLLLAAGAAAVYFIMKGSSSTPTGNYPLPPLSPTGNYTRNTQSQDLVNYAIAGGLAIDAIIKLIDKLNTSSDQEVTNIYDTYHATGQLDIYA